MSEYSFIRPEILDRLNDIIARYDADAREREIDDAYQSGYDDGMFDGAYYCDCEVEERCYDPEHEVLNTDPKVDAKALADAVCERPL